MSGAPSVAERIRVLLVEDSKVYRDSLVFLLGRREGLEVVAAVADGSSAVSAVEEADPDVVVLDYRLPDMQGGEAAAAIRERAAATAIVFLSASAGREEYDAAAFAGAPLVRKDDGIDALVEAVRAVAGRSDTWS
jgi:DNA-binding NarL/FixJ family response regulator